MRLVRATIKEDTTVIWSTAYLDEANSFDNTVVIDKGKVIFHGPPETLAATSADFEREVIRMMGGYEEKRITDRSPLYLSGKHCRISRGSFKPLKNVR